MREAIGSLTALVALLIVGCFGEAPMGETGQTTGEPCQTGALGCACYPNGTCDVNLACEPTLSLCVPPGCTPGERDCVCVDEGCTPPLVCESGICADDGSETSASTTSTTSTTSSGVESSSGSASSDDTTTDSTGTTSGETDSSDDTGPSVCTAMACDDCLMCSAQAGSPCQVAYMECQSTAGCPAIAACQATCAFYFDCMPNCCTGGPEASQKADALTECRVQVCALPCTAQPYTTCSSG